VKRLTVALLVFGLFTPTVFAQSVEQKEPRILSGWVEVIRGTEREYQNVSTPSSFAEQKDRLSVISAWREMVKSAERDYKHKNGRYGDLAALRKAHFLRGLVFESCSSEGASRKARANFVPMSTLIQVTVSEDGQHFDLAIVDDPGHCWRPVYLLEVLPGLPGRKIRDFEDSPEGPIISVAR
jgi:hypothetical protein